MNTGVSCPRVKMGKLSNPATPQRRSSTGSTPRIIFRNFENPLRKLPKMETITESFKPQCQDSQLPPKIQHSHVSAMTSLKASQASVDLFSLIRYHSSNSLRPSAPIDRLRHLLMSSLRQHGPTVLEQMPRLQPLHWRVSNLSICSQIHGSYRLIRWHQIDAKH